MSSSAFSYYALFEAYHENKIQECTHIKDHNQLIDCLKTANSSVLTKGYPIRNEFTTTWTPTIEHPKAIESIITITPTNI